MADYFLLPDLKTKVHLYLFERLAATLRVVHMFRLSSSSADALYTYREDAILNGEFIFNDLLRAVKKIYKCPAARELQKLFAVFASGLRDHLPTHILWRLMKQTPEFQQDISTILISLHFPAVTGDSDVACPLDESYELAAGQLQSEGSSKGHAQPMCSGCDKHSPQPDATRSSQGAQWKCDMVLDPFSLGTRKWCSDCASWSIEDSLRLLVKTWPASTPDSD